MKKIYLLLLLFILAINSSLAQLTVVRAVAIDGDLNGKYGTVEIEFSVGVDDSDINNNGNSRDDWQFSLDPEFSTYVDGDGNFYTDVTHIANKNVADDRYIRFTLSNELASSNGPIYMRYIRTGAYVTDSLPSPLDTLQNFSLFSAPDNSPPTISGIAVSEIGGDTLIVGDKIIFTVDFDDPEPNPNITLSPTQYNGGNLNWATYNNGDTYVGTYIVEEGHADQKNPLDLFDVTAEDAYGNVSDSSDPNADATVTKGIDANTPVVNTVTSDATSIDTLTVLSTITFEADIVTPDPTLTILPSQYNGQNLNWSTSDGGSTYTGIYVVTEGDNDQLIPLQLTGVKAIDPPGNISNSVNGSDVVVRIDAHTPAITDINATTSGGSVLKVGDEVDFEITLATPEYGLKVNTTSFNTETLSWSTSNGSTYTSTYTVAEGNPELTSIQLTGVTISDPAGNTSSSDNSNTLSNDIDSNTPVINSVTSDANSVDTLIVDNIITFTADIAITETGLTISPSQYNGQNLSWTAVSGGDTYEGTYTVTEADQDRWTPLQLTGVTATDDAGNESAPVDGSDVMVSIDANTPVVNSVTSDATGAGVLKIGDKINFTVDIDVKDGDLIINPSQYNGEDLNWFTSNGGSTYKGIYTVTEFNLDRTSFLQLTGVTAADPAGNISSSVNGNDINKTIDANRPVITDVSVTPTDMIFGQTYTITITINSDANNLSLVSGTIAGFNLFNLNYVNATTYEADFTVSALGYDILAGDSYNVQNLILSDFAGNISNAYSETITQAGDPIYTILPTAKVKGKYHVCDKDSAELSFQLTGNAPWEIELDDGSGTTTVSNVDESPFIYKVEALDINGSIEPDTTIYKITQVTDINGIINIMSGTDSALVFAYEIPFVDITDPPGNKTYNIAANVDTLVGSPVGGVFSGNGIVSSNNTFLASSAGLGTHKIAYTYTVPASGCWSSDTVEFEVIESNADITFDNGDDDWRCDYELTMTVTAEVITDPLKPGTLSLSPNPAALSITGFNQAEIDITQLSAGTYEVKFEYDDGGTIVVTRSFIVESVSSLIDITDILDQCEDYDTIFVNAFNLSPSGGTGNYVFSGAGTAFEYDPADIKNNKGYLVPGEISSGSYNLQYIYTTPNGCDSDPVIKSFDVNQLPNVTLTMNPVYNIDQGETTIIGDPADAGGSFYPAFMNDNNDGTAQFDPADAGLGTYWVKYIYEDAKGCVDVDSTQIEVNQALGEITSSTGSFQFCYFGASTATFTGTPNPTDGTPGSFYIDDVLITPLSDNVISFNPQDYTAGDHQVRFEYSNSGTDYQVFKSLNIDSIGNIYFTGLDNAYCESEDTEVKLTAFYSGLDGAMTFTGNGITDNVVDNLGYFNPSNANLGDNLITYTFIRDYSGCQKSYAESVKINNTPTVAFYPNEKCIVNPSDPLGFTSDTLMSDSIVSWDWTYRTNYKNFNQYPTFTQTVPGYNSLKLKLTSKEGCINEVDSSFYIGTRVDLKFTFENECHGETVLFDLIIANDTEDTLSTNWEFGGAGISDLSIRTNPTYKYSNPGAYDVIYEEYTKSCGRIADTVRINIRPSIDLSSGSYIDEFEESPNLTGWVIEDYEEGANNTWQWGEPIGTKINSASSGSNVYATNLSGNYENDEKGMITSPCFDFSMVERPMMKMDYISYTEADRDGVVMQYTKPNGEWATIGVPSDGINWYNSYIISGAPANQQLGWTGKLVNTENAGWNTAMFRLDELRGRAGVRFRIVFGSNGDFTDEGFAFDNIQFKERERLVLLENFTNMADEDANNTQDNQIKPILDKDSLDVININYHNGFPSSNKFYTYYPSGPSARALYYGVSDVPYSIVDGLGQFDYTVGGELEESDIHKRVLVDPPFSISLKQDQQGGKLVVSAYIKALENLLEHGIVVHTAIVEKTVVEESGIFNNVLRTMLPDAAGSLIERDWLLNDSINVYKTWTIPVGDVNADSLITIIFLQDEETKEIYQTAYATEFTTITSIDDFSETIANYDYRVYPNPVKENLTIELLKDITYELDVSLYNGIGALVKSSKLLSGENIIEFNTNDLPSGVYYLRITNEDQVIDSKKIIKID